MYDFGNKLKINISGESHSPEMKVTLSGFPAGFHVDAEKLDAFMKRRSPANPGETARHEDDIPEFVSGIKDGVTDGGDIVIVIKNNDIKPSDYDRIKNVLRPGHADFTAYLKNGAIPSGGGRFSGRMTAPICAVGGIALQYLYEKGITIGAHAESVGGVLDLRFDSCNVSSAELSALGEKDLPVIDAAAGDRMRKAVEDAAKEQDSVGGVIECAAIGFPAGIGGELFEGLEGKIARALFAVPAVKGVEFGIGFAAADIRGSENNDPYVTDGEKIYTETNNCGGILGGISDGMPLVYRAVLKPTPSIGKTQKSVDLTNTENTTVTVSGRHDACIVFRAVPVIEAVSALVLTDLIL